VVLDESIDQVILLCQRHELKRGSPVDGYHHRLVMATMSIFTQMRFRFTQRDHFHDAP